MLTNVQQSTFSKFDLFDNGCEYLNTSKFVKAALNHHRRVFLTCNLNLEHRNAAMKRVSAYVAIVGQNLCQN